MKYFCTILVLMGLIILLGVNSFAQKSKSRTDLENQKNENLKKIREINAILQKTTNKKEINLGTLKALNKEVAIKEQQVELFNKDLNLIENEILTLNKTNKKLAQNYNNLKVEYGQMVRNSFKAQKNLSTVNFLFSSNNFNQLFLRYNYLQQIANKRKTQAVQIAKIQADLQAKELLLVKQKKERNLVLSQKVVEVNQLALAKDKQKKLTDNLIAKEKDLMAAINERKRSVAALENLISASIEREIAKSKRLAAARELAEEKVAKASKVKEEKTEKKESKESKSENTVIEKKSVAKENMSLDKNEAKIGASFSASKARLPWPVKSGFISEPFGSHPHEVLKGITVPNDGIEIQTNTGEAVRAVYNGTVMVVDNSIIGMGTVVAIQHGDYFTIYGKLKGVTVRSGQAIGAKETIGFVMQGADGTSEVQFQIWKNTARQNPEKWLIHK